MIFEKTRLLGILLLPLVAFPGCERRANLAAAEAEAAQRPIREGWGVHFVVSQVPMLEENSRRRVELRADLMQEYEEADSTYMLLLGDLDSLDHRVTATFYDANGDSSATLTADRVYYYEKAHRFEAQGQVIVITSDDKRLESEHLIWLEEERRVRTPGFVRIVTPKERMQGYGLVADEDLETYELQRVTAQAIVEEK